MNKKSLSTMLLAILSLSSIAQVSNKLSVDARLMLERASISARAARATSENAVSSAAPFIIRIDESRATETIEALRTAGAVLHAQIESQLSAEIPLSCLKAVEAIEGVVRIGTAGAAPKPMTDVTRKEMGISAIDGSESTLDGVAYTGKSVTVAVIDVGFDFQHPAYKDNEGRSRIKAYYTPFDKGGNPVVINGMQLPGSVYETPEQIAQLTTDFERQSHGTHTSTIAAGTRSPKGWGGMAPDADIVLCAYIDSSNEEEKSVETITDPTVFDALAFLKYYQEKSGKPMVVNMSIGNVKGPHNGRDEMPQAISDFIAPGRLVAIASGNEGSEKMHLQKVFTSDKDTLHTMFVGDVLQLEGFTMKKAPLSAQLTLYEALGKGGDLVFEDFENNTAKWTALWQSPVITAGANDTYKLNGQDDPKLLGIFDGELYMKLTFDETLDMTQLNWNILGGPLFGYAFELSLWSTADTQLDLFNANLEAFGRANCTGGTTELTGNNWAVADKAVSVGNSCANTTYQRLFYEHEDEEDKCVLGDINPSSSYGKALNGRQIPMVAAPGTNVISGINHYISINEDGTRKTYREDMTWQGGLYDCYTGSSMSSPAVAGTIALWLQANPTLSPEEVEDILRETCRNDNFTLANPQRFGYGKVDAKKGLELVLQRNGDAIPGIYDDDESINSKYYDLHGRIVRGKPMRGLYIKCGVIKKDSKVVVCK